ncbi:hypothetical protein [uncultured Methylobacterium sp.]|uniref:hypothetical protein n=1 Tax=uncultured Methylobacterium sp. TaxID=157278 RepID=UPI0035C9D64B
MTSQTPSARIVRAADRPIRTEAEVAHDPDAVAGRRLVEARVALCTQAEQDAFWEAVRRCFGSSAPSGAATAS